MPNQKPTLNDADIQLLEKKFVTKEDAKSFVTKEDAKKFATKKELKKGFNKIDKKLDIIISTFDREYLGLNKRVTRVENHLNLPNIADY